MRKRSGWHLAAAISAAVLATSAGADVSPRTARATPRLSPCGTALCRPDGSRFEWRGVTAFALADQLADGRDDEARQYVRWAAQRGLTVLRVLAMNHGWMELTPEAGRRALPRVLALAREHGMYAQVVALAGTGRPAFRTEAFLRDQVRAVGTLCAAADNCILELANEPYHGSQADLDDPVRLRQLQDEVPDVVPVTWGAARTHTSDALAGGDFVVAHLRRSGERWSRIARLQDLAALAARTGKFVVDNEPIGAAEKAAPNRRDDMPAAFFAQAAVASLLGVGPTFHCEDCLLAKVPGPTQQRCAEAFAEGARFAAVPGTLEQTPGGGLIERPAGAPRPRILAFAAEADAVVIALGAGADGVRWQPGWRVSEHVSPAPDVHAWRARKGG